MFYFFKNVHIPVLIPIYQKLKELNPDISIAFGYKSYDPQQRAGFLSLELSQLKTYKEKMFINPQHFEADIIFVADSVYDWVHHCGKIVNVGHGILSKGLYYSDTEIARREELADLVFVPGIYHQQVMEKIITTPVIATGMGKLDTLFNKSLSKSSVEIELGLPQNKYKYILFAPTFNDELSSIPYVMDRIVEVIPDDDTLLIIKLHGSTKADYKEMYSKIGTLDQRVVFIDDLDITPLLVLADVMISDVSSAMIEFAAQDKPIILFNNPRRFHYKNYNEHDIEYKFRDMGIQVKNLEEMKLAIIQCFNDPDEFQYKRKVYTDLLVENKNNADACTKIITESLRHFS